jgi:hypothetical protein
MVLYFIFLLLQILYTQPDDGLFGQKHAALYHNKYVVVLTAFL